MIENRNYESPVYGRDANGNIRCWPLFAGPDPEHLMPSWAGDVPDSLPVLVQPGVLHDPMEVRDAA